MFKFNLKYFLPALVLLIVEIIIALYFHDAIIRPFGGDFLVVIMLYCFVKSFVNASKTTTAIGVLIFAYSVEISQHYHLIKIVGLQHSKMARMIMGTSFSWTDMLMYTLGIVLVVIIEVIISGKPVIKPKDKTYEILFI